MGLSLLRPSPESPFFPASLITPSPSSSPLLSFFLSSPPQPSIFSLNLHLYLLYSLYFYPHFFLIFSYSISSPASHSTVAPKIKDTLESILRNAEGLLSYLASNIETLLGDIDPEGLIQAKKEISKVGKGIRSGSGRGRDGDGGVGEGAGGEAKRGIRKGNIT